MTSRWLTIVQVKGMQRLKNSPSDHFFFENGLHIDCIGFDGARGKRGPEHRRNQG